MASKNLGVCFAAVLSAAACQPLPAMDGIMDLQFGLTRSQGLDAVDIVARKMGNLLGWNAEELERQVNAYRATVALRRQFLE